MSQLLSRYRRVVSALSSLQSPMLLVVRLYWGFQFAQTGWGKLHNLSKITGFFASLNIPFPGFSAPAVSLLEFVGGILLMFGLFSRPIAFSSSAICSLHTGQQIAKLLHRSFPIQASSTQQIPTLSSSPRGWFYSSAPVSLQPILSSPND